MEEQLEARRRGDDTGALRSKLGTAARLPTRTPPPNLRAAQVGSESLLDRAKSIKSNVMALFEAHGATDIQGTDQYNACYGGTAALLNCINWVQSSAWDGRWAIAIATDIADAPAQYRFMVGAAAVAVLVRMPPVRCCVRSR